jgi:hypothetical protein
MTERLTGQRGDESFFTFRVLHTFEPAAIVDVLAGRSAGVIFRGFLPAQTCTAVSERFWANSARRRRGVEAPGYYVGAYHYFKTTDAYLAESAAAGPAVAEILEPAGTELARFWDGLAEELKPAGVTVRTARHGSGSACSWLLRSWHGAGSFALAPHEDRSQCGEPRQADFEIQGVLEHEVAALNVCLENGGEGGRLAVWNIRPELACRQRLGLQYTGSPYPVESLQGIERQYIEVRPGDAYVINGGNVHAVEACPDPAGRRTTLACLFGFIDDATVVSWT